MSYKRVMKVQFRSCVHLGLDGRRRMTKVWRVAWVLMGCTLCSSKCRRVKNRRKKSVREAQKTLILDGEGGILIWAGQVYREVKESWRKRIFFEKSQYKKQLL